MSSTFIISLVIQVLLIIHCVRTGRNMIWVMVLGFLPLAGPIAYVLIEVLPGLFRGNGTRRAVRGVSRALDPQQDLRRYEAEARITGDVASRQRYAEELARQGQTQQAIAVYQQALSGLYESDPNLMLGLAGAQFAAGAFTDARLTLERLIERNPQFRSPEGHLLYARALEAEGNRTKALEEYAVLAGYYAGAEAPLRYARLLRASGKPEEARRVLSELMDHARLAPRHYRKAQQQWLADAQRELAAL